MTPEKTKVYTELLKSLTAFILGTGAAIYAIVIDGKLEGHQFFLYFVLILCVISVAMFVAIFIYLDRKL